MEVWVWVRVDLRMELQVWVGVDVWVVDGGWVVERGVCVRVCACVWVRARCRCGCGWRVSGGRGVGRVPASKSSEEERVSVHLACAVARSARGARAVHLFTR